MSKTRITLATCIAVFTLTTLAHADVRNLKVVTDASPDYSDMESMTRSMCSNWETDADKMWAQFYWLHIARRQTAPMMLHGFALTDPIRQFNDYGFTMCSTISGNKCSMWNYMGYPCRYFDISNHTVCEVWYEGAFHHYDNSLSMYYTLPDGKTVAGIEDIGKSMAGPETDGKEVPGYIALYHAVTGTSPNGFIEGGDDARPLEQIVHDFSPAALKYRYYYYDQDRGHRYILNLREGEIYSRYYARRDTNSPSALEYKGGYKSDPAYFVPNGTVDSKPLDPEFENIRYHIRGNGERSFVPILDAAHLLGAVASASNIKALSPGLQPVVAGKAGEAIFKVEGANVITSLKIKATGATGSAEDAISIAISTCNGLQWQEVWKSDRAGETQTDLKLVKEVNGSYEVLVKVTLLAKTNPSVVQLKSIRFDTITEVNGKTQPQLKLGKNTVYVGTGEQTESIVFWPELQGGHYKSYILEEQNIKADEKNQGYFGTLHAVTPNTEGYVVFKIDAPTDATSITYGGRFYNRALKSHIDLSHSFDGGKTWIPSYSLTDTKAPWDVIHYETVTNIPAGTRSVLFKYAMTTPGGSELCCSIYAVRMELNHKLAGPGDGPVEVTFNWSERKKDYTLVPRSHTQLVSKFPATYTINVGGDDHPIVDSLTVNPKGARGEVKYGYSDGKDVGGEKWVGKWATYGKNLALGKPYTTSLPSLTQWGAGDLDGKKLTSGRVGPSYTGSSAYTVGVLYNAGTAPEIIVDLGTPQKCAAFRIHILGYPIWDALNGEVKDQTEVLTSLDGQSFKSVGFFDFNLHWKDLPVNFMWPDYEGLQAYNFFLPMTTPVEARYVKYKLTPKRMMGVTQVQVLDSFKLEPFALKVALPDPASNGKPSPKADLSPNAKKWKEGELPTTIGQPLKKP